MNDSRQRMAEALMAQQASQPNPYAVDQEMEQAAQPMSPPIHPLVAAIMNHMGLLGVIRNRRNQALVVPDGMPQ